MNMDDCRCCLTCEHGEAIDEDSAYLACFLLGDDSPSSVRADYCCEDYNASVFSDYIFFDAQTIKEIANERESNPKPKLKPIPAFLRAI